ncbi:phosphatidylserine decarboxylase-like protein [Calycina marina]|uniref:Phosphatidylserine decarboxylase proenzyme 2 n=1 Tax=Calycina marina TaxID=1763456 RepID=A0A9P8CFH8_9HELO|nr:phosphatidylserine decarboxylase-like protein [Calycina marina]
MPRISLSNRLKSYNGNGTNNRGTSPNPDLKKRSSTMDFSDSNHKGLVLKVVALKARNLAAKDRSGTSDPYLVLSLGDSKESTPCVPKTLNPEWNITLQMPITGTNCLLLDVVVWDKDRFGKDYLGEFDLALEDVFAGDATELPPTWYPLRSKRKGGKKSSNVSGDVFLQFTLFDSTGLASRPEEVLEKLRTISKIDLSDQQDVGATSEVETPTGLQRMNMGNEYFGATTSADLDDDDEDDDTSSDQDEVKPGTAEKKKRKLRLRGLRKKNKKQNGYEFGSGSDIVGIVFLEIGNITDLPPERNMTRTSFDMDPFVVVSLGKKTFRTKVIRHNLNPVFNEKMIFQVSRHEQQYSLALTVIDRDKLSGNDFIASSALSIQDITKTAPEAHAETGLYALRDPPDASAFPPQPNRSRFKLPLSRSSSSTSLKTIGRPGLPGKSPSQNLVQATQPFSSGIVTPTAMSSPPGHPAGLQPGDNVPPLSALDAPANDASESDLFPFTIPLKLQKADKWEEKHSPTLFLMAKYVPYPALRQQFWRAMLKQYDTDESGRISKVELTTMLDTLGSTLKESTIDGFFKRFPHLADEVADTSADLSVDEAVICLEDQLQLKPKYSQTVTDKVKNLMPDSSQVKSHIPSQMGKTVGGSSASTASASATAKYGDSLTPQTSHTSTSGPETQFVSVFATPGEEGDVLDKSDDLNDKGEEHVVEIRECPICHQPRLNKRSDADIITHIATCASQDWRQVNNIVMGGFVTASQAQRKWYSKVITKISYGGYKLGANSANILVQDRITGQINEERMSVYVRLGIRLLYKGLKSKDMETKRIRRMLKGLSIKQGVKYDDSNSASAIAGFIAFHQLNMDEVLHPVESFKNFNEFFYRQLKPDARPCSAQDNPLIIVSPADCRSVVFNRMDEATKIWVKGREFSLERLLGNAYPEDAKRYTNGALGIFRLAPQDYHRFHIPVDGVMGEPKLIAGEYYTVNPMAIRSALDVYGENIRVVIPIQSPTLGRVMVICVGAMMVGSTVITRKTGENVKRAEELGYFKFGGSTILLLFEDGAMQFDDDLVENSNTALETLIRVGMSIGHHPTQSQYTPDMRKNAEDITESDLADANRRIGGGDQSGKSGGGSKGGVPSMIG